MNEFLIGFSHPISGVDHVLAMVAVGMWGVTAGGRAVWVWPAVFVAMVATGFALAVVGVTLPAVEPVIAVSIVILGLLIALTVRAPVIVGAVIVGSFALFHGHSHGFEALQGGIGLMGFAAGFSLATAMLHILGIGVGRALSNRAGLTALRATGAAVAFGGLLIATAG